MSSSSSTPVRKTGPLATGVIVFAAAVALLAGAAGPSLAQAPGAAVKASAPASAARPAPRASAAASAAKAETTRPTWAELNLPQQQALAPLAASWSRISEAQKRKWLALSQNYLKLSAAEQAKLHSRMTEWVGLSPHQRTEARLNFAGAKQMSPDDKKAKWEAYQALPAEEKKKLAADGAATKPPPTAPAIKPASAPKLANLPRARPDSKEPRIAANADQIDHNTLLPQQQPAPPPSN